MSRRWTKLSSTERVNVWAFHETSCKGKPLRGYCEHTATAALPASSARLLQHPTARHFRWTQPWRCHCLPSSLPRGFLPPAYSHQLGRGGEQDIWKWACACQGWGSWTLSRWIYHKDKPLLKQLRYWQKGFHAQQVILTSWVKCSMCTCICASVSPKRSNAQFFLNQFLNSDVVYDYLQP